MPSKLVEDVAFPAGDAAGQCDAHQLASAFSELRRFERVLEEHRDRERANATRYGRERTGDGLDTGMDVAEHERATPLEGLPALRAGREEALHDSRVVDAGRAYVDHRCPRLHEVRRNKRGSTERGDQDVSLPSNTWEIVRSRVAHGNRGMPMQQQQCHRFANDVAATDDDGAGARDRNARSIE